MLDDGIHTLSYFHKNSVKSCSNYKNCDYFIDYYWLLMIIDDYYFMIIDDWLLLWWLLKKIVIANFSSSINEVIRSVLFFFM